VFSSDEMLSLNNINVKENRRRQSRDICNIKHMIQNDKKDTKQTIALSSQFIDNNKKQQQMTLKIWFIAKPVEIFIFLKRILWE
jgi:hypothetical protein